MKNTIGTKIVLIIGFLFSVHSIIIGISVLLGDFVPGYVVIRALLYYNIMFSVFGLVAIIALWVKTQWSLHLSVIIVISHAMVLILVAVFHFVNGTFAIDSVRAMIIRSLLWIVISAVDLKSNSTITKNNNIP